MSLVRRITFCLFTGFAVVSLGCAGTSESVVEVEKTSWVGKHVVAKRLKTKKYLFTADGKPRPAGELTSYTGFVKAEEKKGDVDYVLVRMGREEFWVELEELCLLDEANAYFESVLDESPRAYEPRVLRAAVNIESGRPERAFEDLNEAHRVKPNVHFPLTMRARAYEMMGEYTKAYADYDKVLKFETNNLTVFLGRARVLHALGRTDTSLIDLDAAIKCEPNCIPAYLARAEIWELRKEDQAALQDFDQAAVIAPTNPDVPTARGQFWLRKKDYAKAIAAFDSALKMEPEHVKALIGKSLVLAAGRDMKWHDASKAVELSNKACELTGWKDAAAIDALGVAHAANGNFTEAGKFVKQALDDPLYSKAHGDSAKKRLALFQNNLPYTME
jgi:tetratricopeptide (TPR) repeat protein